MHASRLLRPTNQFSGDSLGSLQAIGLSRDAGQRRGDNARSIDTRSNLAVSRPRDANEQEAERIANTVMAMPEPQSQTQRGHAGARDGMPAAPAMQPKPESPGHPLPDGVRRSMESRFSNDFSRVRVHADAEAAESARSLNARAYTVGQDIVFGAGHYVPGSPRGQHLLAHELAHVDQFQSGRVPPGTVQRAPDDAIEVDIVEVSTAESDLLFHDLGIKLPGSPPRVTFGSDGPIPETDRKSVQMTFDLAYATAASPTFAARLGVFKASFGKEQKQIPGLSGITQQKYLEALGRMTINLADTSKNPSVIKLVQEESGKNAGTPTAGFTPVGGQSVYLRGFALKEGRDALAALILHEAFHVAGVPATPITGGPELFMEVGVHGFEAQVGLPLSQIAAKTARIDAVKAVGSGIEFTVTINNPDDLSSDIVDIDVVDGNRNQVFAAKRPAKKFAQRFKWNGLDASGKPTESGLHSIRVVAGAALFAEHDIILRRTTK
jgi:hypothetical protein